VFLGSVKVLGREGTPDLGEVRLDSYRKITNPDFSGIVVVLV
jgi:hypothetical protein